MLANTKASCNNLGSPMDAIFTTVYCYITMLSLSSICQSWNLLILKGYFQGGSWRRRHLLVVKKNEELPLTDRFLAATTCRQLWVVLTFLQGCGCTVVVFFLGRQVCQNNGTLATSMILWSSVLDKGNCRDKVKWAKIETWPKEGLRNDSRDDYFGVK